MAAFVSDVISTIIVFMVLIFDIKSWSSRSKREKVFCVGLIAILLFTTFNAFSEAVYVSSPEAHRVSYAFKCLAAIVFGGISTIFTCYTYVTVNENVKTSKAANYIMIIPFVWNIICVIINDFTEIMFKFDTNGFQREELHYLLAFHLVIAVFYDIYMLIKYRKNLYYSTMGSLMIFPIFGFVYLIFALALDFWKFTEFPITEVCFSLCILAEYIFFQKDMVNIDALTHCYSRKQCLDDLSKSPNKTVIALDIEMFRQYGFDLGDQILIEIARYLKQTFNKPVYRVASDKFVVIFDNEDPVKILSKINARFENPLYISGNPITVKVRIAAIDNSSNEKPEKVLYVLEVMDSEIKKSFKNYLIYDDIVEKKIHENEETVMKIIRSVIQEDVCICYQGIYSVKEEKVVGAEVLTRLSINDEPIHPERFIPVLIDNQYIIRFDQIVIKKSLEEIKEIIDKAHLNSISINLTSYDIMDPQFVMKVKEAIVLCNVNPNNVIFELCENALVDSFPRAKSVMDELIQFGVRFYLDDFGTGFSNMQTVLNLPFYMIKIDKGLLFSARNDQKNKNILKGIIASIKNVGIKTLIEGVESKADLDLVLEMDIDYVQGFYFQEPSPKSKFIDELSIKKLI